MEEREKMISRIEGFFGLHGNNPWNEWDTSQLKVLSDFVYAATLEEKCT